MLSLLFACMNFYNFMHRKFMKKNILFSFLLVTYLFGNSQNLKFVNFSNGADLSSLSFITDQQIIIKISIDGKIMEWGYELEPGRFYSQPGRLKPYLGRIEHYERQF